MKKQNINTEEAALLRQKAEELLQRRAKACLVSTDTTSEPDMLKLIYELEVHQIELEMQNEELVIAKEKAELAEEKYTELYDFAPSGYIALSKMGEILELNFAAANMLGKERTKLIKKQFGFFVSIDTQTTFDLFLHDVFTSKVKLSCEVIIAPEGNMPIYVNIDGIVSQNNELCLLTVVDITEHKSALEAIQLEKANQEAIFESSPVAMFILDETTNIIQLNAAAVLMTGNSDGEALQHRPGNALGCIHSKKDPRGCGYAEDCKVCAVRNGVESLIANDGSIHGAELELELIRDETPKKIWVRVGAQPIHINGNLQICVAMDDITEHKLAEEKIIESENNFRGIFESHSAAVAIIEPDTTISMVNDSYCKLSGYTREEVIGTSWTKQIPPDDLERLKEYNRIRMLNPAEAPSAYEFTFYHKNGGIKHALMSVGIISGTKKIIASFIDISQRKQAEQELIKAKDKAEESEVKLKEAQRIAHLGNWVLNIETNELLWSDEIYRIFDCEPNEFDSTYEAFIGFIHPDDREIVNSAYLKSLDTKTEYQIVHRIITKNNQLKYVQEKCTTTFNEQGKPLSSFGIVIDITAQKALENELIKAKEHAEESENKFRTLSENSPAIIYRILLNPSFKFEYVSPAVTEITGYTPEDHYADPDLGYKLVHPDDRIILENATHKTQGEPVILRWVKKDGKIIWTEQRNVLIFDTAGNPFAIEGIATDITMQKEAEQELKRIEWLLTSKAKVSETKEQAYIPPYGDLVSLNTSRLILDSVGEQTLTDIVGDYLNMLDTSSAVYEKNGDYALGIFSSGWCRFMDAASRKACGTDDNQTALDCGKWHCHESCWSHASKTAMESGQPADIECNGGIHLYAMPVRVGDEIVGTINFGYGDPPRDERKLRELATLYQVSYDELRTHALNYESRPPYIIDLAKNRLQSSARLIGEIIERKQAELLIQNKSEEIAAQNEELNQANLELNKARETALQSEERFQLAMKASNDGLFDWNLETNEIYYSPGWKKMLGYADNELPNDFSVWEKTTEPEDVKKSWELQQKLITKQTDRFVMEFKMKHKDGHWVNILSRAEAFFNDNGKAIRIVGTHTDITERKQAEILIKDYTNRLELTMESASMAWWEMDLHTGTVFFNIKKTDMLGYNQEQFHHYTDFTRLVHPDDYEPMMSSMRALLEGTEGRYDFEYRIKAQSGEYIWFHDIGTISGRTQKGEPLTVSGIVLNITERKQAEEEIKKAGLHYQALIEKAPDGIALISADGKFKYVSPAGKKMFGYNLADEITVNPNEFTHPDDLPVILTELGKIHADPGYVPTLEYRYSDKTGHWHWVETTFSNLLADPSVESIVLNFHDITERKLMEDTQAFLLQISNPGSDENFFESLAKYLSLCLDMEYVCIDLLEGDRLTAKTLAIYNEGNFDPNFSYALKDTPCGEVVGNHICCYPQEVRSLFPNDTALEDINAESYIGTTLWNFDGQPIGLIAVIGKKPLQNQELAASVLKMVSLRAAGKLEATLADEKVKESEEKFRVLVESTTVAIYLTDLNGKCTYVNPKWCEMAQLSHKDAIGDGWVNGIYEDDRKIVFENWQKMIASDGNWGFEYRFGTPDKISWVYGTAKSFKNDSGQISGFIGSNVDITERKKAEELINQEKLFNEMLIESLPGIFYIFDSDFKPLKWNRNKAELLGLTNEEMKTHNTMDYIANRDKEKIIKTFEKTFHEGTSQEIIHILNHEGSEFAYHLTGKRLETANGPVLLGVGIDVTDRIKAENELVKALLKAEESDRLKSAFLANMSHEIRTPMNGILGFSELLKEPGLTGKQQQEYIKIIEKSGARMLNIINDIVDISKIEAGLMNVNVMETDINEKIDFIYIFFKPQVEEKGMQFLCKKPLPSKEAIIRTDNEKVYSILTNLVKNAIKFSEEGSIEFGYERKGNDIEFFVKDTGIGIPKGRQGAIFERFIQADISDKMARQGAGLGLAISKAYVEMLGGKIWVESKEGIGSTFYFTLPYIAEPVKDTSDWQPVPSGKNETLRKLKILIAEDDEVSEMLIDSYIKMFGKEILKARTGVETVEIYRDNPDIDLILMDIQMPGMNGYEATRQIRQFNKEVVIIAQTAFGMFGDREKAIEAGCNDYISKPINKSELLALIQKYFGK